MMIAPTVTKLIADNASLLGVDPEFVYSYSIDPTVRSSEIAENVVLVSEVSDDPGYHGSNLTLGKSAKVQIQIFFSPSFEGDTSVVRDNLEIVLENEGWYLSHDIGISRDPQTESLFCTVQYVKHYNRNIKFKN